MQFSRRTLLMLAGAGAATTIMTACGNNSGSGGAAGGSFTAPPKDHKAELTYAFWDAEQRPAIEKIIAEFNKDYPNIKITPDITPNKGRAYWTKIRTQASSGTLPEVFWMNGPNIRLYAENDQLLPLDSLVDAKAVDKSNYPESLVKLYTSKDKLYGVPKDFDTIALFYNKALFREAGVDLPTDAWTWEDAMTAGEKISKALKSKGVYGFAGDLTGGQTSWYNTIIEAGGSIISEDGSSSGYGSAESIEGLTFWRTLIEKGISPTVQQLTDTPSTDMFQSKKLAMTPDGAWTVAPGLKVLGKDLGIVRLPKGPKNNACVIHGLANVIPANVKDPAAAQAFVAFLGSKKAAEILATTGTVIPAFNGTQEAWVKSQPGVNLQVFLDASKDAVQYPISRNTSAWSQLESDLLPPAFAGNQPVADVAKQLAEKMNQALAEEKK